MNQINLNDDATPFKRHFHLPKTWIKAKHKNGELQNRANATIEHIYHSILNKAKKLSLTSSRPLFERDYRKDTLENHFAMHAFMSESFYFYLECDIIYSYQIQYSFHNCPFEQELRAMLTVYPYVDRIKEVKLKPDFNTFYKEVLVYQDKKYLSF